ncbi:MAG: cupin domain-containing protein [Gemmatimonadetes bacterium]|nr:cupin domain-containing protein [Gemmatimonadota bacterium]
MKVHQHYRDVAASEEAPGVDMRVVIGPGEKAPNFVMRVFDVEPGASTPYHTHPWEHEVYVISGAGVVRGESGETRLKAGSVVYVAPGERHCFSNAGDEPMCFVCVIPKMG